MTDEQSTALISEIQKHTSALYKYTAAVEKLISVIGSENDSDNNENPIKYLDGSSIG